MNRGRSKSITRLFSDGSPSNTSGDLTQEQKLAARNKSIQNAKATVNTSVANNGVQYNNNEMVQAEERPQGTPNKWNPNSKYSGLGRIVQAVPVLRRNAEKFVASGSHYSQPDVDSKWELSSLPVLKDPLQQLERDKLIAEGYLKEVTIIAQVEGKLRKADDLYKKAKATVSSYLSRKQRDAGRNLKRNRMFALKSLSNPQDERMYSDLDRLYFYCERYLVSDSK